MQLDRGQHKIEVFYEEDELEASISLYWSSKKMPRQVMDGFQMGAMLPTQGLKATYSCEQPWLCYTQGKNALYAIALECPEDQIVLNIEQPSDDTKVRLLGSAKILPWIYRDGQLVIDTSGLKYSDLNTAAWVFKLSPSWP